LNPDVLVRRIGGGGKDGEFALKVDVSPQEIKLGNADGVEVNRQNRNVPVGFTAGNIL
jgi:hypothetical protein